MFSQLKLKLGHYLLKKNLLQQDNSSELITLSNAKRIGVLFEANNSKSIQCVKRLVKYFVNLNLEIDALGLVNRRKEDSVHLSTIHVNYFNLSDLNFFGIPNSQKTQQFQDKEFDILINLSLDDNFQTKYLALMSNARYRVGVYGLDKSFNYDLMFKLKVRSLDYLIEHLIYYLELIDKNNEKQ